MRIFTRFFSVVTLLALIGALVFLALPARAESNGKEVLPTGTIRTNQYTTISKVSQDIHGIVYQAKISTLPQVMADGRTLIDPKWYKIGSGFTSGINTFKANVVGTRVSITDEKGRIQVYDPVFQLSNQKTNAQIPTLIDDPYNHNYKANTLRWFYGPFATGAYLTRYLRIVEGYISETITISKDPGTDVIISLNAKSEKDFSGKTLWLQVFDANWNTILGQINEVADFVIPHSKIVNIKYPLIIDPTTTFASSSGSSLRDYGLVYNTVWSDASALVNIPSSTIINCGQLFYAGTYDIRRCPVIFDTTGLPGGIVISAATMDLYIYSMVDTAAVDPSLVIQSGQPTYPHDPIVLGDYGTTHYSGVGGYIAFSDLIVGQYNHIPFTSTGLGWIQSGASTKLILRSDREISAFSPASTEMMGFYNYPQGVGYYPTLTVIYSSTPSAPTVTTGVSPAHTSSSATFAGLLNDDGSLPTSVNFVYSTDFSYSSTTTWIPGIVTGQSFQTTVTGLAPTTLYNYKAQANNSLGTDLGANQTVTTDAAGPPAPPGTVLPTVTTLDASGVGSTAAILNGILTDDGGTTCDVRFEWDTDSGSPYANQTPWISGNEAGTTFNYFLSGLTTGIPIFFVAEARNSIGTATGVEKTFTPVFTAPTNFVAKPTSSTTVDLQWTKQGDQTQIVYKSGGYPIDRADGTVAGLTPNATLTVPGLTASTTYYFRAWSWKSDGTWSATYADAVATTFPGSTTAATTINIEGKTKPSDTSFWTRDPAGTVLVNIPFFYEAVEAAATTTEVPDTTLWFMIAVTITAAMSAVIYFTTNAIEGQSSGAAAFLGEHEGKAVVSLIMGGVTFLICSAIGMAPPWVGVTGLIIMTGIGLLIGKVGRS